MIPGVMALARLDGGGFSAVYRGKHIRTGGGVVVKVLPTPFDRESRSQFDLERARLGRLRHVSAILQVDDVDLLPDRRPYLVSELCTDSVAELLQRGDRLPAQEIAALGQELADALTMAHDVNIVHGGITPRNALFRRSGQVVLSDFGLALRRYYPGDPAESGEYTAPETLRDGALTELSDLYGLGATLYAALVGRPPFPVRAGEHPSERILRVMSQTAPPVDPELASPELCALLAELLATQSAQRPADAAVVAARFAALPERPAHVPHVQPATLDEVPEEVPAQPAAQDWSTDWSGLLDDVLYKKTESKADPELPAVAPEPAQRGGATARSRTSPRRVAAIFAAVVVGLLVLAVLPDLARQFTSSGKEPAKTSPRLPPVPLQAAPTVQLLAAADHGQAVQLTWTGDSALEYAVIVAAAGMPAHVLLAHHAHSMRVPVSPGQRYCFQIQATNGQQVVQSAPRAIRGAVCRA